MSNIIAKLAILFAGVIVLGAFLNLFLFAATVVMAPLANALGLESRQAFGPLYFICLAAGAVTSFLLMRPVWRSVGKKTATRDATDHSSSEEDAK